MRGATLILAAALLGAGCGDSDEKPEASKPATAKAPKTPDPLARVRNTLEGFIAKKEIASFDIRNGTVVVNLTRQSLPKRELEGICLNAYTAGGGNGAVVYAKSGEQLYTCP